MSPGAIAAKIKFGRWQRVHAGVYATFTGPITRDAQLWAAVLAAGPGAQLSHQTAAEINRLTDHQSPFIHVTIPANRRITSPRRRDHSPVVQPDLRLAICPRRPAVHLCRGDGRRPGARRDRSRRRHRPGNRRLRQEQGKRGTAHRSSGRQEEAPLARRPRRDHPAPARAARTPSSSTATTTTSSKRTGCRRAAKQVKYIKPDGSRGYRDRYYEKYKLIVELDGKQYHPPEHRGRDQDRDNDAAATVGATLRYGWVGRHQQTVRLGPAGARRAGQTGLRRPVQALLADLRCLRAHGRSASKDSDLTRRPNARRLGRHARSDKRRDG